MYIYFLMSSRHPTPDQATNHLADYLAEYHKLVMPFGKTAGRLEELLDHYHSQALSVHFQEEEKQKLLKKIIRLELPEIC